MKSLDRDSPVPLYIQLAADLHKRIDNGEFSQSGRLPAGAQLADEYQVSTITVRQAIGEMVDRDVVVRKQGKGTFFKAPQIEQNLERLYSLGEILSERNLEAEVRILDFRTVRPSHDVRRRLHVNSNETVLFIKRLHLVDDIPVVCADLYVAPAMQEFIEREELYGRSIYQLLEEKGNVNIAVARQEITALAADASQSEILDVPIGAPLLCMENVTYTDAGIPIDNTFFFCRPDRYRFVATVKRTRTELSLTRVEKQ